MDLFPVCEKVLDVFVEWSACPDLSTEFKRVGEAGNRQTFGGQSPRVEL